MAPSPSVQRTAPIAIAPKPSRTGPAPHRQPGVPAGLEADLQTGVTPEPKSFPGSPVSACRPHRFLGTVCPPMPGDDDDGCVPCQLNGADCCISASPRPRKRKLNGNSSVHEAGSSKRSSPGMPARRLQHHSNLSSPAGSSSFLEEMANVGGPTLLKRTLGLQNDRYSQYIGPTTDFEPSLINLSTFDPQDESLLSRGTLRKVSDDETFLMLPDHATPGFEHMIEDVDAIEAVVAPHGRKLIDIYFEVVHPAFPIVQKHVFLEKHDRSHREFSPPILAAVYILAINWWEQCETLSRLPRPDVRELERLVRSTLQDAMNRPKLSTIQAGLLLSQRPEGDQWAPTAQLVAVGQELGLHLDCSGWKIPPWEKGLRRRLAWALYMQDKWGALVHGRPSHIFSSNWAVRALSANDFPDVEWDENNPDDRQDIEQGRQLFTRAVQLSEILAEILDTFYTLESTNTISHAGSQATHLVLSMAKPVQLKLKEWYGGLPASLRLESYSTSSPPATQASPSRWSSIGYLHLAYFATEITLHRRIIRALTSNPSSVDPYIQHICRSAAKARLISAMDFVNRLTPGHLRSFWYFASKANFALIGTFGSLLWATSPGREEADWYRRRLAEYRWTLSVSSKPGGGKSFTEFAMTMLDISTGLLKQLPEKPSISRSVSQVDMAAPPVPSPLHASFPGSFSGGGTGRSMLDRFGIMASSDFSGAQSPVSAEYTSDDEVDDRYATRA
ncbi:fungal specific transcription factor [Hirsutella rhossiliensis]|uniref:Fungal specific transcription factor domain-containing protein n=1 Tax=Hirsutella rhossiliensis TaxID=111463 RepID=A0A9P8SF59_9HYPO|nr:fungal specific transcription factor domain-containing protein [Hirsutella rhossiliensis]KAH0958686.1 fungal specific transcription factor domain-containing protein [Hirsutella rhossiliensis]